MMNKLLSVASYLLVLLPFHAEATQFHYNQDMQCDYPVSANIKSISCDGTDTCRLGDEMVVYGSITLEESLPSSTLCTTVKSCFLGFSFLCKTHLEKVDVCEELGMSSNNGATACPSAGSFYFDYTLELPTEGDWMIVGSGWWVTVFMTLNDCNEYNDWGVGCKATFDAISDAEATSQNAENYADDMYAAGAILVVVGVGYMVLRKRRTASIDLEKEENGHFEMMSDGVQA